MAIVQYYLPACAHRDECPERGMLMTACHVLDAIHSLVFSSLQQHERAGQQQQPQAAGTESALQPW